MKPYYSHAGITIYHGDCREILPQLPKGWCSTCGCELADEMIVAIHLASKHEVGPRFELLLTDPPYGIGRDGSKESTGSHGGRKAYEFMGWDSERPDADTFRMILGAAERQIIWGANYFTEYLPPSMGWLVWDKGQRIDQSDGELAFSSHDRALRIFTLNRVAIMLDGAAHPAQKPVALMKWCIRQDGVTRSILDPFAGSFTTLKAAKDCGIPAIGIEIEEKYCEIAAKRLSQEVFDFK
ncbi:MAG: dpnA 3 [Candidatus Sulfotelmatobacter sp.]|nr:dpnA 3 [Candidatus Sulfotelmatobacter sp.]